MPQKHVVGNGWAWVPVPFQTQFATGCSSNNWCCGLAAVNMATAYLHGVEPSDSYLKKMRDYLGLNKCCGDGTTAGQQLDVAKNIGNARGSLEGYFSWSDLKQALRRGNPVVVGVKYSYIHNKCSQFNGYHSFCLIGYKESIGVWTVNDPLCRDISGGINKRIPSVEFRSACEAFSQLSGYAYGVEIAL